MGRAEDDGGSRLEVLQSLEVDAVLDMKWSCNTDARPLLAVADAKGTVSIYTLNQSRTLVLKDSATIKEQESQSGT